MSSELGGRYYVIETLIHKQERERERMRTKESIWLKLVVIEKKAIIVIIIETTFSS